MSKGVILVLAGLLLVLGLGCEEIDTIAAQKGWRIDQGHWEVMGCEGKALIVGAQWLLVAETLERAATANPAQWNAREREYANARIVALHLRDLLKAECGAEFYPEEVTDEIDP